MHKPAPPAWLLILWIGVLIAHPFQAARAADAYQGLYITVDPYDTSPSGIAMLDNAAASTTCTGAEPFCSDSNGVLLDVDWCRFEGYPDSSVTKNFSCHYVVGTGKKGVVESYSPNPKDTHACPTSGGSLTSFDECSASDFVRALNDIVSINLIRKAAGYNPLKISLGLEGGISTPETYLLDQTISQQSVLFQYGKAGTVCGIEPQIWVSKYTTSYLAALDELIHFVSNNVGAAPNPQSFVYMVKVSPAGIGTLEFDLPGTAVSQAALLDPRTPYPDDIRANCPTTPDGADTWINAYTGSSTAYYNTSVIQAMEKTFGRVVGNIYATLKNLGQTSNFAISVATNNTAALPQINCGTSASGTGSSNTCTAQALHDEYSGYYLFHFVSDLFPASGSTVGLLAAQNASLALGQTLALTPAQIVVNTTQLVDPVPSCTGGTSPHCAAVSLNNLSCNLNETASDPVADQRSFTLTGASPNPYPVTGVGTSVAVQTMNGLNDPTRNPDGVDACTVTPTSSPQYLGSILNYAISNGAQFIEITPDLASDSTCSQAIKSAKNAIGIQTQTKCLY